MIAFHRRAAAMIVALWMVIPVPGQAQDGHETAFVIGLMESMNALSIRFNREVCGYILRHPDGAHYSTTKASWGGTPLARLLRSKTARRWCLHGIPMPHGCPNTTARCHRFKMSKATCNLASTAGSAHRGGVCGSWMWTQAISDRFAVWVAFRQTRISSAMMIRCAKPIRSTRFNKGSGTLARIGPPKPHGDDS